MFYGITRFVPENVTEDQLCDLVTNCIKGWRIGSTRSYKLQFSCRDDLTAAMSAPVAFEYERVHLEEFVPLPSRCYSCQAYGHTSAACKAIAVVYAVDKKDTPTNVILPAWKMSSLPFAPRLISRVIVTSVLLHRNSCIRQNESWATSHIMEY